MYSLPAKLSCTKSCLHFNEVFSTFAVIYSAVPHFRCHISFGCNAYGLVGRYQH
jgi:hypothetical protein